ncbi:hypothetical protein [Streptacidiphilus sp. MAP5-3]|uniref:hypothetical protein n=1 Tax=unclassified Streptacidiphilus TaxID=2643834 RepID=UPI003516B315
MTSADEACRRPWWSLEQAASYLGITAADLRYLGTVGIGPRYIETFEARKYRPADVRLWAATGLTRDSRGWNGEAR